MSWRLMPAQMAKKVFSVITPASLTLWWISRRGPIDLSSLTNLDREAIGTLSRSSLRTTVKETSQQTNNWPSTTDLQENQINQITASCLCRSYCRTNAWIPAVGRSSAAGLSFKQFP